MSDQATEQNLARDIPVLVAQGRTLAMAYENALIALNEGGIPFKTQDDRPGDPPSRDCTMNISVLAPLADPMIHKAFPGGIEDLREYVMELQGAKDEWVKNMNDPADTRWEYTYPGRLAAYGQWRELRLGRSERTGPFAVDQIQGVIEKLARQPFSRQAQMITWMPNIDTACYDPPCLQSLWYRIVEDKAGAWRLNVNVRFRSNDAWGANFMNMFGFTMFNRDVIAAGLAKKTGREVKLGRMNWHADSFHIYGKDIETARQRLFNRMPQTSIEDRVLEFWEGEIQEMYQEAESAILEKIRKTEAGLSGAQAKQ